jgi:hypothetical protein
MKRNLRKSKKIGKRVSKKRVYKKRNFTSLRKITTKKQTRRRGPRKMRGGIPPFYADESYIEEEPEDNNNLDTTLSLDETINEEGQTDFEGESTNANSFSNVAIELPGNPFNDSNISAISNNNNTSAGTMSVGELDLNNASTSGNTTLSSVSRGGRREKGKKTQKRRMGKKGGELPFDYNPNDVDKDAVHD